MCEGIYCVLLFDKEMYAADYNGVYGLIGGRIEPGEPQVAALLRELNEETKLGVDDVLMIKDTGERRTFKSNRCAHPNKTEIHYMYVLSVSKAPQSGDIKVAKVTKKALLESIPYPTQKTCLERIFKNENI